MKSIFSHQIKDGPWIPVSNSHQIPHLHKPIEITLGYETPTGIKASVFLISKQLFIELDSSKNPIRYLELYLALFEPFCESLPYIEKYGFYLNSETFFTNTQSDLDFLIKELSKVCILTCIECDFVFIKTIGKGSTATVYLCETLKRRKKFAVKCFKKAELKEQSISNLAGEIQILREVNHENICRLFYVYENQEFVYLVLEYLPFGNLLDRLQKKDKFSEGDCRVLLKKLLLTLDFMHCRNIVHRDLKLENILLTSENDTEFKLIDLGLAYDSQFLQNKKCGSPGYVAPEILRDEEYDCKIDIFSSGVILYILLHGHHPFRGRNTEKVLYKNLECEMKISKKLSQGAREVLFLMLEPFQELRPSASQLLNHPWFSTINILSFPTNPT